MAEKGKSAVIIASSSDAARAIQREYSRNWRESHPGKNAEYCRRYRENKKRREREKAIRRGYWERKAVKEDAIREQ